jgi:hypothetical protein
MSRRSGGGSARQIIDGEPVMTMSETGFVVSLVGGVNPGLSAPFFQRLAIKRD